MLQLTKVEHPPFNLDAILEHHKRSVLAERDDGTVLHASDLHSCDFALWQRLHGVEQLPHDDSAFTNFERGLSIEQRIHPSFFEVLCAEGFRVEYQPEINYAGIEGHPDFIVYQDGSAICSVDIYTSAKGTEWNYGHALKNAFYSIGRSAPVFCEWVWHIGFAGKIITTKQHWFYTKDWVAVVDEAIDQKTALAAQDDPPEALPPIDPRSLERETWRCEKGYCRARCDFNARYRPL